MLPFTVTGYNAGLIYVLPEIFLGVAACALLLADLFIMGPERRWTGFFAVLALLVTAVLVVLQPVGARVFALGDMFQLDRLAQILELSVLIVVAAVFVYSIDYLRERSLLKGEYFVLGLFATLGMMVLISAASFITLYIGLELMSLCLYAMVAFDRDSGAAAESAIKFFVLGSLASGTLLYGMSIVYGVTGSLELTAVATALQQHGLGDNVGILFGIAFIIVGLGFKMGAVPFHMWIPDVYQGSPACVTLFIGSAPEVAGFALAIRLLVQGLGFSQPDWSQMLVVLAVLSMAIGNVVAIAQTNLKRMLAYSTIAHVGYILLGILSGTTLGYSASLYYVVTYVIAATGAFGMILLLSRQGFEAENIADFRGLFSRSPWFAAMMAIFMFSFAGLPPFIGFWAKLGVIQSVLGVDDTWLGVVAVLFSLIGAYYYLRIVKLMMFDEPTDAERLGGSAVMRILLSGNALLALALGVAPGALLAVCDRAMQ